MGHANFTPKVIVPTKEFYDIDPPSASSASEEATITSSTDAKPSCDSLAFNADGSMLAVGLQAGAVAAIDASTGKVKTVVRNDEVGVSSVSFAHHASQVLYGGRSDNASPSKRGLVLLHSLYDNMVVRVFHGHKASVGSIAVHTTMDRIFTASDDGSFRVWDPRSAACAAECAVGSPCRLDVDRDSGMVLAVASDQGMLALYDSRQFSKPFKNCPIPWSGAPHASGEPVGLHTCVFSGDGKRIAVSSARRGVVQLDSVHLKAEGGFPVVPIVGSPFSAVDFSSDSSALLIATDRGEVLAQSAWQPPHPGEHSSALVGSGAPTPAGYKPPVPPNTAYRHSAPVLAVRAHPTADAFATAAEDGVALWSPPSPE